MPVVRGIALDLDTSEVLRRAGVRQPPGPSPAIADALRDLMAQVKSRDLLRPALAYETYAIAEVWPGHVRLEGDVVLRGGRLASDLMGAQELAAAVVTIGNEMEQEASRCFGDGEPLRGLLLDAIGSAAVDRLVQDATKLLADAAADKGYEATCPVSPGHPGFPLSEQRAVFGLAPAGDIGVHLTDSGMMLPQKSASLVIGLGLHMAGRGTPRGCAHCNLSHSCAQRRPTLTRDGGAEMLVQHP